MAKRAWILGGTLVAVTAVAGAGVVAWRTAEMFGVVANGDVDLGVELTPAVVEPAPERAHTRSRKPAARASDRDPAALRQAPRDVVTKNVVRELDDGGFTSEDVRLDASRIYLKHEARSAWRQRLSEDEVEAVRQRIRDRHEEMTPAQLAAKRSRRDARKEAIGLPTDPDGAPPDDELPPDEGMEPDPE